MRTNKLFQVLTGLVVLATSLECGKSDHIHLKIHVPTVVHKHHHIKTKLVHMFHPKVIHTDHSSVRFLHRRDPNVGNLNRGFPQPMMNVRPKQELRITEEEYNKWRELQYQKALDERRRLQEDENGDKIEEEEEEDEEYDDNKNETADDLQNDLYKKHKANKANSTLGRKETTKHKNHNYQQTYEATNYEKTYANHPEKKKTPQRRPQPNERVPFESQRNKPPTYGFVRTTPDIQAAGSDNNPQYIAAGQISYNTIPTDLDVSASDHQDDIYSGLLTARYDKKTVAKSNLLADINYNRKKQTKAIAASLARRSQ